MIAFTLDTNNSVILFGMMELPAFCNFCTNLLDIKVHIKLCYDDKGHKLCNNVIYHNVSSKVLIFNFVTFDKG